MGLRFISEIEVFDSDLECFSKIWDYYYKEIVNHKYQQIPISLLIIKLMNILKRTNDKALITKALLITISFFPHVPADLYNNRGIEMDLLPKKIQKQSTYSIKTRIFIKLI